MNDRIYVTYNELRKAYEDCRHRKRQTENCIRYEMDENRNLYDLYVKLNDMSYKVGPSTCFVWCDHYTKKYREIFAANFEDRIVQHLLVNRILPIFEYVWNDRSFSCRKEKGTLYGVHKLQDDIMHMVKENPQKQVYVMKLDIKSFFDSINRNLMLDYIKDLISRYSNLMEIYDISTDGSWAFKPVTNIDITYTIWLLRSILMKDIIEDCILNSSQRKWRDHIPKSKSAFFAKPNHYLPVGNITSQMFANIFLSDIEHVMADMGYLQGRYVDDIYVVYTDTCRYGPEYDKIKNIISSILMKKDLQLQESKTIVVEWQIGLQFIGKYVKGSVSYILNKTKGKFINRMRDIYAIWKARGFITYKEFEYIVSCVNSYLGLFCQANSYNIRKQILMDPSLTMLGRYCYIDKDYKKLMIYREYLLNTASKKSRRQHLSKKSFFYFYI